MVNLRAYLCDMLIGKLTRRAPKRWMKWLEAAASSPSSYKRWPGSKLGQRPKLPITAKSAQCTWDWELLKKWLGQQAESRLGTWWSQYWGRSTSRRRDSALSTTTSCGGSIELSGPQQRWSAVSRNTVSRTQWKTQKMGSLFEMILNF